jgi:nitroreductase
MADFEHVVRTAFAAREFTDRPVTASDVSAILDVARFASSGGNQQGWRVVVIRSGEMKSAVIDAGLDVVRRYVAQQKLGERAFNSIDPTSVTDADVAAVNPESLQWYRNLAQAPVVLAIGVDLGLVAAIDSTLERVGIVSGASIYPFVHNVILAAHARGLAGVLTTFAVGAEGTVKDLLELPSSVALAAIVPLGYPTRVLTRLNRNPVEEFARWEHWNGPPVRTLAQP